MKTHFFITLLLAAGVVVSFTSLHKKDKWTSLFNGKDLSGWDTYLGPPLDNDGKKISDIPVGLNNDPDHVFTVADDNGEKVIRISGESWGGISTTKQYENFHLQLMFKWGSLQWKQKRNKKRDSGLLYFAVGDQGADGAWMRSQEFQVEETNTGDYWGVAGAMEDIPVTIKSDSEYVYNPSGQLYTFSADSKVGRHCIKSIDAEKPSGEWNTLDLYCNGDTSIHVVNGKVVMILYHSSQLEKGNVMPLAKGKLQLQSEGAEVFYKNIRIQNINGIPNQLIKK